MNGSNSLIDVGCAAQIKVENRILTTAKGATAWATRVFQALHRRQLQAGTARTDKQGGNHHVHAVQRLGLHETRNRHAPPFDQHPAQTLRMQPVEHRQGLEPTLRRHRKSDLTHA